MIFDPLPIVSKPVALMQDRSVLVRQPRTFIEMAACKPTKPIKMWFNVPEQMIRKINTQQISQHRIGAIEIHARCVGRN
jgi:hypothetical protein